MADYKMYGIISLVLGIASFLGLGLLGSIPGLILGNIAKKNLGEGQDGYDFAKWGYIVSLVNIILGVVVLLLVLLVFLVFGGLAFLNA